MNYFEFSYLAKTVFYYIKYFIIWVFTWKKKKIFVKPNHIKK